MISISTYTANASGNVIFQEDKASDLGERPARVSRTKTLDGGVVITHSGASHGDRTLKIVGRLTESKIDDLITLHNNETFMMFSTPVGFFLGVIETLNTDNGDLDMTVLVKEKIT